MSRLGPKGQQLRQLREAREAESNVVALRHRVAGDADAIEIGRLYARSAGAGSDLLPMEVRFLPPVLLMGGK
jgi:hypothetical protein